MTVLRIMWRRHGIGGRGRQARLIFTHGYHAGSHAGRLGDQHPCDSRCEEILSTPVD